MLKKISAAGLASPELQVTLYSTPATQVTMLLTSYSLKMGVLGGTVGEGKGEMVLKSHPSPSSPEPRLPSHPQPGSSPSTLSSAVRDTMPGLSLERPAWHS